MTQNLASTGSVTGPSELHLPGHRPGKVVAVHLSYRSRADQRGRRPEHPSYFLKPSTTVAPSGRPVVRPDGCELLAFEGEIALVIGRPAYRVGVEEAWAHVGWLTAADDFGVYDLRHADGGSNLRSKGIDGYTPIGPMLIDARAADPQQIRVRTWVDGHLVQDALTGQELLFGFDQIVADLSRLMTLEVGDVILTGTPAGSGVVRPGQTVEVEVSCAGPTPCSTGRLVSPITADDDPLAPLGAMPAIDDALRALAFGLPPDGSAGHAARGTDPSVPRTDSPDLSDDVMVQLARVSTATLASQLRKHGLDGCTMDGLRPSRPGVRLLGRAKTVRYLPLREDLFATQGGGMNAQKRAVDEVGAGEVLVISARSDASAGTIGDILALRAQVRGAAGVVTDGAVRDSAAVATLDLPVFSVGTHPAVLGRRHVPWDTDIAISCAGVLVRPGDLLVGDDDGVVVVPPEVAGVIATAAVNQEREEQFIAEQVAAGDSIDGLYPIGPDRRAEYEAWCREGHQA